jgi:hypothetical protein
MIFELDDTEQLISNAEGGIDLESGVDLDIKADSTINIIDKDEIKIAQEIYAKLKPTIEYVDFDNGRQ